MFKLLNSKMKLDNLKKIVIDIFATRNIARAIILKHQKVLYQLKCNFF